MKITQLVKLCLVFLCFMIMISCESKDVLYFPGVYNPFPGSVDSTLQTNVYNDLVQLQLSTNSFNSYNPAIHYAADLLVYQRDAGSSGSELVASALSGLNSRVISAGESNSTFPVITPSGQNIVFYYANRVAKVSKDGGSVDILLNTPVDGSSRPLVTIDEHNVIVTTVDQGTRNISVVGMLGASRDILTEETGGFEPDMFGSTILYLSGNTYSRHIHTIQIDGTEPTQLTYIPDNIHNPQFSSDGKFIVYSLLSETGFSSLYIMTLDGESVRRLTFGENRDTNPNFIPDNRWISFIRSENGNSDIYFVSTNGQYNVNYTNTGSKKEGVPFFSSGLTYMFYHSNSSGAYNIFTSDLTFLFDLY